MTEPVVFTELQKSLLAGRKGYFFESCMSEFGFLLAAGFRHIFDDLDRNLYRVSFSKDDPSDRFTIQIYHEDDDLLWCDLVCVSGDEIRVRFAGQVDLVGAMPPEEKLDDGPVIEAARKRVHELAEILALRWPEFRDSLLSSLREKKKPNHPAPDNERSRARV